MYAVVIGVFVLFSPISFGMVGPSSQWKHLAWLDTWRLTD
jgi:dolichyl-phosphate-mannose-protein mannosyltransferase